MMIKLQVLFFISLASACSDRHIVQTDKKSENIEIQSKISIEDSVTEIVKFEDTLIIKGVCVVLFSPDSTKVRQLKNNYGLENFYIMADDNLWYLSQAREFLQSNEMKIVETKTKTIQFIDSTGNKTEVLISNLDVSWGCILFDGRNAPKHVGLVGISEHYFNYFSL